MIIHTRQNTISSILSIFNLLDISIKILKEIINTPKVIGHNEIKPPEWLFWELSFLSADISDDFPTNCD
jgi:hypothetical protein